MCYASIILYMIFIHRPRHGPAAFADRARGGGLGTAAALPSTLRVTPRLEPSGMFGSTADLIGRGSSEDWSALLGGRILAMGETDLSWGVSGGSLPKTPGWWTLFDHSNLDKASVYEQGPLKYNNHRCPFAIG